MNRPYERLAILRTPPAAKPQADPPSSSSQSSRGLCAFLSAGMELTAQQLKGFDGSDASKPIYVAVRGKVYDVTSGKGFYGPGGPYAVFAGREASRALAKMSKHEEEVNGDLSGLSEKEMGILEDWEKKLQAKYPIVGGLTV